MLALAYMQASYIASIYSMINHLLPDWREKEAFAKIDLKASHWEVKIECKQNLKSDKNLKTFKFKTCL